MKPYLYNDEYIDLGEIGQHECQITAVNLAHPTEPPNVAIMTAKAYVRLSGCPMRELDVTPIVRDCPDWKARVQGGYTKTLERLSERPA